MEPYAPAFEDQMRVLIEKLKNNGVFLIGTATTLTGARLLEEHQIDAVIAQGSESGGHRGTFIGKAEVALFEVELLVKQLLENVKITVIAAGGIMDAEAIVSTLALGAGAVP